MSTTRDKWTVLGERMTRTQACAYALACGWAEVLTAGGPVPVRDWKKSAYKGELVEFVGLAMAFEAIPDDEGRISVGAVWHFGNFS